MTTWTPTPQNPPGTGSRQTKRRRARRERAGLNGLTNQADTAASVQARMDADRVEAEHQSEGEQT